jgi:hypothetical protein
VQRPANLHGNEASVSLREGAGGLAIGFPAAIWVKTNNPHREIPAFGNLFDPRKTSFMQIFASKGSETRHSTRGGDMRRRDILESDLLSEILLLASGIVLFVPLLLLLVAALT